MEKIFPGSKELTQVLQWYDYSLYDITSADRAEPPSWEEIVMNEPAQEYYFSRKYLFVPIPHEGQKLRQAYAKNRLGGFFPVLRVPEEDLEKKICPNLQASYGIAREGYKLYLLHELYFGEESISAFSSPGVYIKSPSRLRIPTNQTVEVFSRYFSVVHITKQGIKLRKCKKIYVN